MDIVDKFYALVDDGRLGNNHSVPIGLPKLEEYIEGLSQGTSYLIGAGSGVGKTTLLLYSFIYKPIMAEEEGRDVRFIMFNLEMSEEQILGKLLSIYIYETYGVELSFKDIFSRGRNSLLSDDNYKLVTESRHILEKFRDRIIFHPGTLNADKYENTLTNDLKQFGTFLNGEFTPYNPNQIVGVVTDHLNLVRASAGRSKKDEVDAISNRSVSFRNKCRIVSPINLMQLNRNANGQERLKQGLQEPDESDLKETATVLEDSMIVLLMFNPIKAKLTSHRSYDITQLGTNYRSIKCIKNRFGTADVAVGLGFYGNIGVFKELPKASEISDYQKYLTPDWCILEQDAPSSKIEVTTQDKDLKVTLVL